MLGGDGPLLDAVPSRRARADRDAGLEAWRRYRLAFAEEAVQ
jgi:hypothetical protein